LEPGGLVEIKYRRPQILAKMGRLDPMYKGLMAQLSSSTGKEERDAVKKAMLLREQEIYPVYHSAALMFSDLHDVPERMLAKGVICGIVDWKRARCFFYERLKRRIAEERVIDRVIAALDDGITKSDAKDIVLQWYSDNMLDEKSDNAVSIWLEENELMVSSRIEELNADSVKSKLAALVEKLSVKDRAEFLERLQK
jgi:acetyl-CoA carboxylase/biotin carboxylase 1